MTKYAYTTVKLNKVSGVAEDAVQNGFAFRLDAGSGALTSAEIDDIEARVSHFYNTATGQTQALAAWLGSSINHTGFPHTMKTYQFDPANTSGAGGQPVMGSPLRTSSLGLSAAAANSYQLPDEIAAAVSIHGSLTGLLEEGAGGIRPKSRHRGRLFFGPVCSTALAMNGTTGEPEWTSAFRSDLTIACARMVAETVGASWCVWSRSNRALYTVTGGYVDNAPDVQRRRGQRASARTSWGV